MSPADPETFTSDALQRVRHNPWLMGLAASPLLLSLAAFVAGVAVHPGFFVAILHPAILALGATVYVARRRPRPRFEPVQVRADREGIQVGDERVPRAALREGLVVPPRDDRGPQVELRRKGAFASPLRLTIHDRDQGRRLLHALGFDASQTVATFRALSMVLSRPRYVVLALTAFFLCLATFVITAVAAAMAHAPGLVAFGAIPFALGYVSLIGSFTIPTKIAAGADGLMVSWLWWKRFVRYGDIRTVTRFESGWGSSNRKGLAVVLQSGEEIRLPISQDAEAVAILEERIQEAMETYRRGDAEGDAALVRRNGREVSAWITALRSLGAGSNADLRTAPLPRERLFRIVESPTASAGERAAAAIALGTELDEEGRTRLRSAAEATAVPKLRIAIEQAAGSADEEALREALAAVESEQDEKRALA
ncbi:MAG: hypothetical protein ABI193_09710 [Minicystis sp.]